MRPWWFAAAALLLALPAWSKEDTALPYGYVRLGAATDVTSSTRPGTVLMGGNHDVAAAFQWLCERSGGGDFLVIRVEGTDAYNPYVARLCPRNNSVATLIVPDRAAAFHPDVAAIIGQAEALWIASGDQAEYLDRWTGTPIQQALRAAIERGVPVGGTSAGLDVLMPFIYSTESYKGVTSTEALADPYHERITLQRDFVSIPWLARSLGDGHFRQRDRMGRALALLCRIAVEGWATRPRAIAVDEDTAMLIDERGRASVVGVGSAYLLAATGPPEVCARAMPVTYRNIHVYRIDAAGTFDLSSWRGKGGTSYHVSAQAGILRSTQPDGRAY